MHPSAKRSTPEVRKLGHIWNVITPADMVFQTFAGLDIKETEGKYTEIPPNNLKVKSGCDGKTT